MQTWASHWLPFRPSYSVYSRFDYCKLPPVDLKEFEHYRTVDDVKENPPILGPSPIFAEWCFDLPGMFLYDPSFDIFWSVDGYGRVVLPGSVTPVVVAQCLAEFLARMTLENSIWWNIVYNDLDEEAFRDQEADPDCIWDMLKPISTDKQLAYLRPYYLEAKNWHMVRVGGEERVIQ